MKKNNAEQPRGFASYKVVSVILFVCAIIMLQVVHRFRDPPLQELLQFPPESAVQVVKNKQPHANDVKLPEEDPDFQVPNPHTPFIVAIGKRDSLSLIKQRENLGVKTPKILVWNGEENWQNDEQKDLEFVFSRKCGGCQMTRNRGILRESKVVIIFYDITLFSQEVPDPRTRNPEQVYVFWSRETQSKTVGHRSKLENSAFDSIFNLTFYFRRDSDIRHYFGNYELALRTSKVNIEKYGRKEFLESKTKDALWFVSNCDHTYGATQRMLYARRLVEAGLKLDKFGKCFSGGSRIDSKNIEVSDYRYYLSFENSIHCRDYVTEKFWRNALQSGLVPIVWGPTKSDVEAIAPPHSFIYADDFPNPEDLVEYLNYLSKNNTAYMEYHRWREADINVHVSSEDIAKGPQASLCRLCQRQVLERHPPKSIPSVSKWMFGGYVDDKCFMAKITTEDMDSMTNF